MAKDDRRVAWLTRATEPGEWTLRLLAWPCTHRFDGDVKHLGSV